MSYIVYSSSMCEFFPTEITSHDSSDHAKMRAVHKENETSDTLVCSRIYTVASPEKRRQPGWRCSSKSPLRIGAENPNSGERRFATCQSAIAQSNWSKLVKQSTLVKYSNLVK